jgi:hypothetical protein
MKSLNFHSYSEKHLTRVARKAKACFAPISYWMQGMRPGLFRGIEI